MARRIEPPKTRNKPATKINMDLLREGVLNYPDSFQYERAQRFGVSASGITLALLRLKISDKKTWNHPKVDKAKHPIVYLDESGFAYLMPRTHGYSPKGSRCYGQRAWDE